MSYTVTVGYATYNRKRNIEKRISEVKRIGDISGVEFIFVDNFSTDGSFEFLERESVGTNIKVYRNDENLGFAGNFVEVLRKASGKYVIWFSDEDAVDVDGLIEFLDFCKRTEFGFLVSNYDIITEEGGVKNYRKKDTRLLGAKDFSSCAHLPGIVFNRECSQKVVSQFSEFKEIYPSISEFYPHFFIMLFMLPKFDNYFYGNRLALQVDHFPHQHKKVDGAAYYGLSQRWQQHNEIVLYVRELTSNLSDGNQLLFYKKFIDITYRRLYERLRSAMAHEDPLAKRYLDIGAAENVGLLGFVYRIKNYFLRAWSKYVA